MLSKLFLPFFYSQLKIPSLYFGKCRIKIAKVAGRLLILLRAHNRILSKYFERVYGGLQFVLFCYSYGTKCSLLMQLSDYSKCGGPSDDRTHDFQQIFGFE